jgi:hypothetical protein
LTKSRFFGIKIVRFSPTKPLFGFKIVRFSPTKPRFWLQNRSFFNDETAFFGVKIVRLSPTKSLLWQRAFSSPVV